jgi:hypothetical protein
VTVDGNKSGLKLSLNAITITFLFLLPSILFFVGSPAAPSAVFSSSAFSSTVPFL